MLIYMYILVYQYTYIIFAIFSYFFQFVLRAKCMYVCWKSSETLKEEVIRAVIEEDRLWATSLTKWDIQMVTWCFHHTRAITQ